MILIKKLIIVTISIKYPIKPIFLWRKEAAIPANFHSFRPIRSIFAYSNQFLSAMKKKLFIVALFAIVSLSLFSQRPTMELTFTAVNYAAHVQLDSIKVMNRTQGGDTLLYWPDTVLSIYYVGINEIPSEENAFHVFQNYPNPVADQTTVSLYVPEKDKVSITVIDFLGRMIIQNERVLDIGKHTFQFTPGNGNLYFFNASWQGQNSRIKILHYGLNKGGNSSLLYSGSEDFSPQQKTMKDSQDFSFSPGDELLYIGYADTIQSGMLDSLEENSTYTFQFATNIPCPGTPTVEYEGQMYNTIQIFSQCWLKENLNVGTRINGNGNQANNGIIEKYCYENLESICNIYGGLYQWNEMMQYTTQQGVRGICPPGWHVPTDEEWKVLEGAVDSQFGIGDPEWDIYGELRGTDAGTNLKTTSGWDDNGNGTDLYGFSGLPGGLSGDYDSFVGLDHYGFWWASTEYGNFITWLRYLHYFGPEVYRGYDDKGLGFSVRCLRDY